MVKQSTLNKESIPPRHLVPKCEAVWYAHGVHYLWGLLLSQLPREPEFHQLFDLCLSVRESA